MYCKYSTQNLDSTVYPEYKFETNNSIIELVYVDSSKRQIVLNQAGIQHLLVVITSGTNMIINLLWQQVLITTESGDFRIHTFTGDGNFIVDLSWMRRNANNPI